MLALATAYSQLASHSRAWAILLIMPLLQGALHGSIISFVAHARMSPMWLDTFLLAHIVLVQTNRHHCQVSLQQSMASPGLGQGTSEAAEWHARHAQLPLQDVQGAQACTGPLAAPGKPGAYHGQAMGKPELPQPSELDLLTVLSSSTEACRPDLLTSGVGALAPAPSSMSQPPSIPSDVWDAHFAAVCRSVSAPPEPSVTLLDEVMLWR